MVILRAGGITEGGINFDAKIRRNSTDLEDLFYAHIGGIDVFARALLAAHDILAHSPYQAMVSDRYASFDQGAGQEFENGKLDLMSMARLAMK